MGRLRYFFFGRKYQNFVSQIVCRWARWTDRWDRTYRTRSNCQLFQHLHWCIFGKWNWFKFSIAQFRRCRLDLRFGYNRDLWRRRSLFIYLFGFSWGVYNFNSSFIVLEKKWINWSYTNFIYFDSINILQRSSFNHKIMPNPSHRGWCLSINRKFR